MNSLCPCFNVIPSLPSHLVLACAITESTQTRRSRTLSTGRPADLDLDEGSPQVLGDAATFAFRLFKRASQKQISRTRSAVRRNFQCTDGGGCRDHPRISISDSAHTYFVQRPLDSEIPRHTLPLWQFPRSLAEQRGFWRSTNQPLLLSRIRLDKPPTKDHTFETEDEASGADKIM
ncbi:hypothetical protein L207DRAFT_331276 [Hyaloscypha variabilis F]|uniref:Uncharacterized protein n=1 Tax=Hyaloscypha variabilis (strain UAMH 11265 / GT02V1 / F) TaxID=1149755 RepID=A0A2J6RT81_HYAVF|nr:hypothetical protein L207DRAFT_331276 [Hyaloscypha variabilis F]